MAAVLTVWSVPQEAPMKCSVSQRDVGGELAACVRVSFWKPGACEVQRAGLSRVPVEVCLCLDPLAQTTSGFVYALSSLCPPALL